MRLAELTAAQVEQRLSEGIGLDFGAARVRVLAQADALAAPLSRVYGAFPVEPADGFFDVTVRLRRGRGLRRLVRPQVEFIADGQATFAPFPADTALPLLEWGMNFLFAQRMGFHLLLHAGVVEKDGRAVLMPALPGSGKSTLTAALVTRGFRLLSDEFGVVRHADGHLLPMVRPIALKNASIDVIGRHAPDAILGPRYPKTRKGTVAHLAPDARAVAGRFDAAPPALVVFPRYAAGVGLQLVPEPASRAFGRLAVNSFNYEMLGPVAFDAVARLVQSTRIYSLTYSDLDQAVGAIGDLLAAIPR
jgi:HprK-related kinase A